MKRILNIPVKRMKALGLILIGITTFSCGSYQNSSYYDNDGIYGSNERPKYERPQESNNRNYQDERSQVVDKGDEYARKFEDMKYDHPTEGGLFTNIDNYATPQDSTQAKKENYAGWGQNSNSNVIINVIDNGWGWNAGWGWNRPWGWNAGWGYGWNNWGWGWNNWGWGWNDPWFNNWGWNGWHGGYYGPGWNNVWGCNWNNGWNNGWSNRVAYSSSRRGGNVYTSNYNSPSSFSTSRRGNSEFNTSNRRGNSEFSTSGSSRGRSSIDFNSQARSSRGNNSSDYNSSRGSTNTPREFNSGRGGRSSQEYNTPRSYDTQPRSYDNSPSRGNSDFGGGRSGGGNFGGGSSGGGRIGGGGGRGGRGGF